MTSIKVMQKYELNYSVINLIRLTSHKRSLKGKKKKKEESYLLNGKIKLDLGRIYNELKTNFFQCVSVFKKKL